MTNEQLRKKVEEAFQTNHWEVKNWRENEEVLVIGLGKYERTFEVSIPKLQQRMAREEKELEEVIAELLEQAKTIYSSLELRETLNLREYEVDVFPVIRSGSFPIETPDGKRLLYHEHTAESKILYALDLGKSYTLIDEQLLTSSGWSKQELREKALFNLRRLHNHANQDEVAGNIFYFISPTDGYGASRILNQALLQEYRKKIEGDFCLGIPHQDVLILADIRNKVGYDVLGQVVMSFYRQGSMPITMLPFDYKEGQLEPIFILANKK